MQIFSKSKKHKLHIAYMFTLAGVTADSKQTPEFVMHKAVVSEKPQSEIDALQSGLKGNVFFQRGLQCQ